MTIITAYYSPKNNMGSTTNFQIVLLIMFGFLAVIAVLMFAGVIPGGSSFLGDKSAGEIVMWGPAGGDNLQRFFEDLSLANEKTVRIRYVAQAPETYLDKLIEAFARGGGPDAFFVDQNMIDRLTGKITDIPFSVYAERDFRDNFVDGAAIFAGTSSLKALPLLVDPLMLYYNRTLYSSAGIAVPPARWDDFLGGISALNRRDERGNFKLTAAPLGEFVNIQNAKYILSTLMLQAGNPITTNESDGSYRFDLANDYGFSPAPAVAAVNFYLQFSNPSLAVYSWNRSMDDDQSLFIAEQAAAYFGFASELSRLKAKNPHLALDVAPLPQKDLTRRFVYGSFTGIAIAGNSRQKSLAYAASRLLTETANLSKLAEVIGIPPARRDLLSRAVSDPWQQAWNGSALYARSFVDPDRAQTNAILTRTLENIQTNQISAPEALTDANGRLNLLFKTEER